MSGQRGESLDTTAPGPDKSVQDVAFRKGGIPGKSGNIAVLVDCRRRVPKQSPKVANVSHRAVLPKHGVGGSISSNRLVADARYAHGLSLVIDRRGRSRCVTGNQREFVDLVGSGSPDDRAKLKNLGRDAGRVMTGILRPPDYLTAVVGASRKAVISTQRGKCAHHSPFPPEPEIDIADIVRPRVESRATPELPQRVRRGSLGSAYDDALVIFHIPC